MQDLKDKKIKIVRPMTAEEKRIWGWDRPELDTATVIELEDGTILYPSCDEEGNGPGVLFCTTPDGTNISFC